MKEIKFRGKRISDGDWFYGDLITEVDGDFNITNSYIHIRLSKVDFSEDSLTSKLCLHEVDPKTVGQYTGLKDKKDEEYYEGDICVLSNDRKKGIYTVVWQDNGFELEIIVRKKYGDASWNEKVHLPIFPNSYEVIGNIYENPELLEVSHDKETP